MSEAESSGSTPHTTGWKLLLATDGSECAVQVEDLLTQLAFPAATAIHVVAVAADPFVAAGRYGDTGLANWQVCQELLDTEEAFLCTATSDAVRRLSHDGWKVSAAVRIGAVSREILLAAEETGADLILLGTRGRSGMQRLLLGSTAQTVARHASCSVLVVRKKATKLTRVLLAVDGSEHSNRAVQLLARLPLPPAVEVLVVHVMQPYHPLTEHLEALPGGRARLEPQIEAVRRRQHAGAERTVHAACRRLEAAGKRTAPRVLVGHTAEEILKLVDRLPVHLLVVGARGVSLVAGLLVGSVAEALLQRAACSVLIAR